MVDDPFYHDDEDASEVSPILPGNNTSKSDYTQNVTWFVYLLTFFAAIGGFLFGYDTGVISGAMIPLKKEMKLSKEEQELVVSITIAGAIVGSLTSGFLNQRFGRRFVLLLASFVFTVGAILMALASSVVELMVGRLVVGLGIGYASSTVPMYIAEAAPADRRGQLVTINQLFITFGQLAACIINGGFSYVKKDGWRYMLGIAAVPSLVLFFGFIFMPESPRWLISKGRIDEAKKVLSKLRGQDDVGEELQHIEEANAASEMTDSKNIFKRVLSTPSTRRALLLGCALQAFQQLSGINTVMYYSATIIELAGVEDQVTIIWLAAVVAGGNFVFTLVSMLLVEKVGRRKLTLVSIFGVCVALFLLAGTFVVLKRESPNSVLSVPPQYSKDCGSYSSCYTCVQDTSCGFCFARNSSSQHIYNGSCLATNDTRKFDRSSYCNRTSYPFDSVDNLKWGENVCPTSYAWLAVVAMIFYLGTFAPGLGPMPWAINAEIYPLWARGIGMSASTATNWTLNLFVSLTFLDLLHLLTRPGAFSLYAVITFFGFIFFYCFLPETKGKKLEEVEDLFKGPICIPCGNSCC